MNDFIEQQIINAVRRLLTRRVNELLGEMTFDIPCIEMGNYNGENVISPVVSLVSCERTEKERIIKQDAYSLTITFNIPETTDSELFSYVYGSVVCRAVEENPTLEGIADRAVITGKKYIQPKKPDCGQGWELIVTLRISIERNIHDN